MTPANPPPQRPVPPPLREVTATFTTPAGRKTEFRVEVAESPAAREKGLMFRRELPADRGMVFVFPSEEAQEFWMKNTYVPLDIVFIGSDLRVVGVVEDAKPLTLDIRSVGRPSRFVVELRAYTARTAGIEAGTRVEFEPALY